MKRTVLFCAAAAGLVLMISINPSLQAGERTRSRYTFAGRRHMDVLANRMRQDANDICWEMYHHYRHNPGYRETYREMYRVMKDAEHIHDLVHEGFHFGHHEDDHIARDLYEIDKLFHHIEEDVEGWSSSYRGYRHDHYGHYVHGSRYRDALTRKLSRMEQTLHHLMADYGVKSKLSDGQAGGSPPPVPAPGVVPKP